MASRRSFLIAALGLMAAPFVALMPTRWRAGSMSDEELGISIRFVRQFNIVPDAYRNRVPIGHPGCFCKHCQLDRAYRDAMINHRELRAMDWYMDPEVNVITDEVRRALTDGDPTS